MSWGVDEKGEPQGDSPAQNAERHLLSRLGDPLRMVFREDTPLTSDRTGAPACLCPGQPPDRRGGGDLRRPQIPLRTVFNICKTATRAAKVNSVPGSSKVSEFKCFPFGCKESARACGRAPRGGPPRRQPQASVRTEAASPTQILKISH